MDGEKRFIEARQERYREAHNSLDVERLMGMFVDDVDYSDKGLGVANIDKDVLRGLATSIFDSVKELVFTTVSVNGSKEFTAWEWASVGIISKEIPGFPMKVGDEFKMVGCSLFWWVGAGEAENWKIKKEVEYSKLEV